MKNTVQIGDTLDLIAPAGGVVINQGYLIGNIFAVAGNGPFDAGELFPGVVVNVVTLTKTAAQVIAPGELIYWDDTAKEAGNVGPLDAMIGAATKSSLGGDATLTVRLNGISQAAPVTFSASAMFVSTEQTGDGSAQNIPHGLGVIPAGVLIVPTDTAPATVGDYTSVQGVHDATNVIATVTTGKKYVVWAMG